MIYTTGSENTQKTLIHCLIIIVTFRQANDLGLLDEGFIWIVTDAIVGEPEKLAYKRITFPSFYKGLLGTVPRYGEETKR